MISAPSIPAPNGLSTYVGQCPDCRKTLELEQATVDAARGDQANLTPIRCECGAALAVVEWLNDEIDAYCGECGTEYVVNCAGAGEELPCRCGSIITIPTNRLQCWQPPAVSVPAALPAAPIASSTTGPTLPEPTLPEPTLPEPTLPEPTLPEPTLPVAAAELDVLSETTPGCDLSDSRNGVAIVVQAVAVGVALPIVAAPELCSIEVIEREAPSPSDVRLPIVASPEVFAIDLPSVVELTVEANSFALPIVAAPELYSIEVIEREAPSPWDVRLPIVAIPEVFAIDLSSVVELTVEQVSFSLPIVAAPVLYSIEVIEREAPSPWDGRLPIVASPEVFAIDLPSVVELTVEQVSFALPIVAAPELCSIEVIEREAPSPSDVRLPIVASPEVFAIDLPSVVELTVEDVSFALPIVAAPELYSIEVYEESTRDSEAIELPIIASPLLYAIDLPVSPPILAEVPEATCPAIEPTEPTEPVEPITADSEHRKPPVAKSQTPTADASDDQFLVSCPGCQNEYPVPRDAIGESAECECGFVFQIKDNLDAIDSAFTFDLVPYPPLALDRTGSGSASEAGTAKKPLAAKVDRAETVRRREVMSDQPKGRLNASRRIDGDVETKGVLLRYLASTLAVIPVAMLLFWFVFDGTEHQWSLQSVRDQLAMQMPARPVVGLNKPTANSTASITDDSNATPDDQSLPAEFSSPEAEPIETAIAKIELGSPQPSMETIAGDSIELAESTVAPTNHEQAELLQAELSPFLMPVQKIAQQLGSTKRLDRPALQRFASAIESLRHRHRELTPKDLRWLGRQWASLGERASTAELASRCYYQASSAYSLLLTFEQTSVAKAHTEEQRQMLFERSRHAQRMAVLESGNQQR
ncbi:hypothetical protein [Roseiconus lacunae]|uniref:hypothetical protein n=1 Tax=Roseiconus lacunae TaxID=2605694 RepID=UPI0011F2398A|nr:hypothetical protein [Roseiconus lacunae]